VHIIFKIAYLHLQTNEPFFKFHEFLRTQKSCRAAMKIGKPYLKGLRRTRTILLDRSLSGFALYTTNKKGTSWIPANCFQL
jgi:hypothetical protein